MKLKNKKHNKRDDIISKIIIDRAYDIPEWVYDYVNQDVVIKLLENELPDFIFKKYIDNPYVKDFYDNIRHTIRWSKHNLSKLESTLFKVGKSNMLILLLNDKEWKYMSDLNVIRQGFSIINLFNQVLITDDIFIDRAKSIVKAFNIDKTYLIRIITSIENNYDYIDRLMNILEVNKSYELCEFCLKNNIPALFKNADCVDLYRYLYTIIINRWMGNIDENIVNIEGANNPDIIEMLAFIVDRLNNRAIKLLKLINEDIIIHDSGKLEFLDGTIVSYDKKSNLKRIVDFNDYITIYGNNSYGLPIEVQEKFINDGGDIETMFKDSELLPEASIIKTMDKLSFIIDKLGSDDIGFLLKNSHNFVMNILSKINFTQLEEIKILRALFVYPIDTELWELLNNNYNQDGNTTIDYRVVIINKFIADLTLTGIFLNIPKAMAYLKPSTLFITRYINKDNIPYIPVEKLIPHINSIISSNEYTPLNLFSNGNRVSITNVIDLNILIQNIIRYNKYGYICDITEVEPDKIIDILCKDE